MAMELSSREASFSSSTGPSSAESLPDLCVAPPSPSSRPQATSFRLQRKVSFSDIDEDGMLDAMEQPAGLSAKYGGLPVSAPRDLTHRVAPPHS